MSRIDQRLSASFSSGLLVEQAEAEGAPTLSFTVEEAAIQLGRANTFWSDSLGQKTMVTYAFRESAPGTMPGDTSGFSIFNAAQIRAAEWALGAWADVSGVTFERSGSGTGSDAHSNNATILFGNYASGQAGAGAFAYRPETKDRSSGSVEGDVWINSGLTYNQAPTWSNFGPSTLLHEIGHALGLKHPGDYQATDGNPTYADDAVYIEDSLQYTVMSYFSEVNTGADFGGWFAAAPMMHDIAAMQRYYGANTGAFSGDTSYGYGLEAQTADYRPWYDATVMAQIYCVWDTGGTDTLDFSGYGAAQRIDLNTGPEHFSDVGGLTSNVSIFDGVLIENARGGSGSDLLIGNDAANRLEGGGGDDSLTGGRGKDALLGDDGDDTLQGGAGDDTMTGGLGNDTFFVSDSSDVVKETQGEGRDRVFASVSFVLGDGVEELWLLGAALNGTGNSEDNLIVGDDRSNVLIGAGGDDTLKGGKGKDSMDGGSGDDVMFLEAGDLSKDTGGGTDTIRTGLTTVTLGNGLENLAYTGKQAFTGIGNQLANLISSGRGADTLNGMGGVDTLKGGKGDDTYIVTAGADIIREGVDGGTDTVLTTLASYALGNQVEVLIYQGSGSFRGTGSPGDDTIIGGAGADTLDGGLGADLLRGGRGGDTYVTDSGTDLVVEAAASGIDTLIYRPSTYPPYEVVLPENIENLILDYEHSSIQGGATWRAVGNDLPNRITGAGRGDWLNGMGGDDTLAGGKADDVYYLVDGGDRIIERQGEGFDTVYAVFSARIAPNVERLYLWADGNLTGTGSRAADVIVGYDDANKILGGGSDDTLSGGLGDDTLNGGPGADRMTGGQGRDVYHVDNAADVVIENAADLHPSMDVVLTTLLDCTLADNVEYLTYKGDGSAKLTGNGGNNVLTGGDGDDTLIGGLGSDTMFGGKGDDVYYFYNDAPEYGTTAEEVGNGYDTANIDTTITAWINTSNIEQININRGDVICTDEISSNIVMTGSGTVRSGGGDDVFTYNGSNKATFRGDAGADITVFSAAMLSNGGQIFVDIFNPSEGDVILIPRTWFNSMPATLTDENLVIAQFNVQASEADDFLLYNVSTSELFFDRDGSNNSYAKVLVGWLYGATPTIENFDFIV